MLKLGDAVEEEGGWKVLSQLGQGTCCEVYKVHRINTPVIKGALKIYREGTNFENAHDVEALLLDLVTRANGPCKYLVSTVCSMDWEERPCLVQELLDCDLRHILAFNPCSKLSLCLVHRLAQGVLRGLNHLHKSGFVHGDLKPTNLLWSPADYCLKIIDFGLSFHLQDQHIGQLQSLGYRSPEVERWNASLVVQSASLFPHHNYDKSDPHHRTSPSDPHGDPQNTAAGTIPHSGYCSGENIDSTPNRLSASSSHKPTLLPAKVQPTKTMLFPAELATPAGKPQKAADMWSVGCILVEMYTGEKLFTAQKLDYLHSLRQKGFSLEHSVGLVVTEAFSKQQTPKEDSTTPVLNKLKDLVHKLLELDVHRRLTAEEALDHSFFHTSLSLSFLDLCVLPSSVLRLLNIIEDTDLEKDNYQNLCEDITEECRRYGELSSCVVPTEGAGRGKVYLAYSDWEDARQAYSKLSHRHYNSHNIVLSYFPTQDFLCQNYY